MSVINTFVSDGIALQDTKETSKNEFGFPETVVVTFIHEFADLVLNTMEAKEIGALQSEGEIPIYSVKYKGKRIGFYLSKDSSNDAAELLAQTFKKGAKRVIFFGSCRSLFKSKTNGKMIIPTITYRDDGKVDFIEVESRERLAAIFYALDVPFIKAKVWTSSSVESVTKENCDEHKKEGCVAVDSRCAFLMDCANAPEREVYQFLYDTESHDNSIWDQVLLGVRPQNRSEQILDIAFETAIRL